jgi:hypothetical protein
LRWSFNGKRALAAASREEIKDAFGNAESDPGKEMPMINIEACPVRNAWIAFR